MAGPSKSFFKNLKTTNMMGAKANEQLRFHKGGPDNARKKWNAPYYNAVALHSIHARIWPVPYIKSIPPQCQALLKSRCVFFFFQLHCTSMPRWFFCLSLDVYLGVGQILFQLKSYISLKNHIIWYDSISHFVFCFLILTRVIND